MKDQFKFLYRVNRIMFIVISAFNLALIIITFNNYRLFGLSYEVQTKINDIVSTHTVHLYQNMFIIIIFTIMNFATIYSMMGWRFLSNKTKEVIYYEDE